MNKVIILLSAFVLGTTCLSAQTSEGNMMIGGTIEFNSESHQSGSSNDASGFTFAPSFGYFVSDNLAIGAGLTIETERTGTGSDKTTRNAFGFGPFARYYKFTSNDRFAIFGQAGFAFSTGKVDPPAGDVRKTNSFTFSVFPGAAYFFNEHWALELAIAGLSIDSTDPDTDDDDDKVTRVRFGVSSLEPSLGIRYHF